MATALASQAARHLLPATYAMDLTKREIRKRVHDDDTLFAKVGMGSNGLTDLFVGLAPFNSFRRTPLHYPNVDAARLWEFRNGILKGNTPNCTEKNLVLIFQSAVEGVDFAVNHDSGAAVFVRSTGEVCGMQSAKFCATKPGTLPMGISAVIPWKVLASEARNLGLDIHLI